MKISKETYAKFADAHAPKSPLGKDCLWAFLVGGSVCTVGQILRDVFQNLCSLDEETAGTLTSVSLILAAVVLTALGIFDNVAKHAGAGTLVPVTGFSNSITAEAVEARYEGYILGVGAKIFTVAGPVIAYSLFSGAIYGVILFFVNLFLG